MPDLHTHPLLNAPGDHRLLHHLPRHPSGSCCCYCSVIRLFGTPLTAACQVSLSFTISWSLLKLMSVESVMPSNYHILCRPLPLPPPIFPSIRIFSNKSTPRIRWPKYFSFSISPSNEYSGLISSRMDWFDLLEVQGTPKSLLQLEIKPVHPKGNQP